MIETLKEVKANLQVRLDGFGVKLYRKPRTKKEILQAKQRRSLDNIIYAIDDAIALLGATVKEPAQVKLAYVRIVDTAFQCFGDREFTCREFCEQTGSPATQRTWSMLRNACEKGLLEWVEYRNGIVLLRSNGVQQKVNRMVYRVSELYKNKTGIAKGGNDK